MKAPAYWNGTAYTSAGAHFAVWLLPTDGIWPPELDVAESYAGTGIIDQNVHYGSWPGNLKSNGQRSNWDTTGQFNLYAMEWSETEVRVFVNGTLTKVMDATSPAMFKDGYSAISQLNATSGFYLLIDTQIAEDTGPLETDIGSTEMLVDWVKVFYRPGSTESYTHCSWENETCSFSGTKKVRYGANGSYVYKDAVSASIACTNTAFGDPAPGVVKSCGYTDTTSAPPTESYTHCSWENETCSFSGTKKVRYGANGSYVYKDAVSTSIACTNTAFGDPAPGVVKSCGYTDTTSAPPTESYTHCSWENETCSFSGTKKVRYGANGSYVYKDAVSASIACTNTAFGDPAPGVVKSCGYTDTTSAPPTESYTHCSWENETCSFSGTKKVRYGANGWYIYKDAVSTSIACTNTAFGGDPAPNVAKSCATGN